MSLVEVLGIVTTCAGFGLVWVMIAPDLEAIEKWINKP